MRKLSHWLEAYTPSESEDFLRTLALAHAELGGEVGTLIASAIRRSDFKTLCEFSLDYSDPRFLSVTEIAECRQALAFFSKLRHLNIGVDKDEVAMRKWREAELRCSETNALFRLRNRGEFQFTSRVETVFDRARRKIAKVLGRIPKLEDLRYRFGPGATSNIKKKDANPCEKLQRGVYCSEDLFPYAKAILEELPLLADLHSVMDRWDEDGEGWATVPVTIDVGRLDFVAKNASTSRITVIEPMLNSLFQLAVGDLMMDRLARSGLNLRDQSLNQRLAREGSLTGELATLDLKSASDTISKELVFDLLPLDWAIFLSRGRSTKIRLPDGTIVSQDKFSSMGNGFTFPLESLIFWALTASACPYGAVVNVFGDDIVCPTADVPLVKEVLNAAGFWVNDAKSYSTGPFRESCGKDYYRGIDIRPYYQKDLVSGRSLFLLHNYYVRAHRPELAQQVLGWIHPSLRIWGPDGYGDGHLLGVHPRRRTAVQDANGYSGYLFDTFTVKARRDIRPKRPGDYVFSSYSIYMRGSTPLLDWADLVVRNAHKAPRIRDRYRPVGLSVDEPSSPIPVKIVDGEPVKAISLPGEDGYKRISIYTLGV